MLTTVDKLVAEEDPGQNRRTSMYKGLGRSRVSSRRILGMLFRKIVSSNNGHYYLSLYLAHAPWIRKAGYQFMSHRESVCWCRWKKDQGDLN